MTSTIEKSNHSIFNGVATLLATGAGQSVLQIFILAFFARMLTPESFGIMAIALAVSDIVRVFARAGVTQAIIQFESVSDEIIRVGFTISFIFGLFCCALLYSVSGLASSLLLMESIEDILKVMAFAFPVVSFSLVSEALLSRKLNFHVIAMARLWGYVVGYAICGLLLAYNGYGYWSLIYSYLVQQLIQTLILIYNAPHSYRPLYIHNIAVRLFRFGFGYSLGQIATILALRIDSFLIARLLGPVPLSFYDRSYQLMRFPAFLLATIVDDALFPIFSKMQKDDGLIRKTFSKGLGLLALVLFPLSMVVAISSESIINVLLGSKWVEAIPILQVLSLAMFFRSAQRVSTATLRAKGLVYRSALIQFVYFLMILAAVFLGEGWGIFGVSCFVSLAIFFNFLLVTYYAAKVIELPLSGILKPIMSALPLTIVLSLFSYGAQWFAYNMGFGHFSALFLIGVVVVLLLIILINLFPKLMLGRDGEWLMDMIKTKLNKA